jgi:hypothetical protein
LVEPSADVHSEFLTRLLSTVPGEPSGLMPLTFTRYSVSATAFARDGSGGGAALFLGEVRLGSVGKDTAWAIARRGAKPPRVRAVKIVTEQKIR